MPHSEVFISGINMLHYLLHVQISFDDFPVNDKIIKGVDIFLPGLYKFNSRFMFHNLPHKPKFAVRIMVHLFKAAKSIYGANR